MSKLNGGYILWDLTEYNDYLSNDDGQTETNEIPEKEFLKLLKKATEIKNLNKPVYVYAELYDGNEGYNLITSLNIFNPINRLGFNCGYVNVGDSNIREIIMVKDKNKYYLYTE